MCAQRDEFDKTSLDEFAHEIAADVNVARKFPVYWIFTHTTRPNYPMNFSDILLTITEIFESFTEMKSLLLSLTGDSEISFGGRQREIVRLDGDFSEGKR